ncbi:MAG TPA: bis(5'-nucleosyl)-tetraphosphatase (symmetrical) YqeK [Sporolactobacillaceae bacterium]|nr:bis(5'-nucleosyl)-tetraphosphatase (symmetrical) YqeK [Sporolactobacillaceae bacterium]
MDKDQFKRHVEGLLPEKRFQHTLRVADTAVKLANTFGGDPEKAEIASLLHDLAKYFDVKKLKESVESHSEISNNFLDFHPELWHAPVGAVYAKEELNVVDPDILNAITYHTTGRAEMSLLEKIVFLADYIEPGRQFPGVEEVRSLAKTDLDKAIAKALKNTIEFLLARSQLIYPDTLHAYNAFISKLGGHVE